MLEGLPDIYARVLPELRADEHPVESRATCATCAMWPDDDPNGRRTFVHPQRCCTYVPSLPNFLVGRALSRGGPGADRLRARIRHGEGVSGIGILPRDAENDRYGDGSGFGLDPDHVCPYFVGGELSCGIWADRNSVCRTWHCKWHDGRAGRNVGNALRNVLESTEIAVATWLATGAPWPWSGEAAWEAFFLSTAARAEALDDAEIVAIRESPRLRGGLVTLRTALAARSRPMPEVLETAVHEVELSAAGRWRIFGEERWDPVEAPPSILLLLGRLSGGAEWREPARALGIDESIVRALWRANVLVAKAEPR
jgi:hypothetical protein